MKRIMKWGIVAVVLFAALSACASRGGVDLALVGDWETTDKEALGAYGEKSILTIGSDDSFVQEYFYTDKGVEIYGKESLKFKGVIVGNLWEKTLTLKYDLEGAKDLNYTYELFFNDLILINKDGDRIPYKRK